MSATEKNHLDRRRERVAGDWGLGKEIVLIPAGTKVPIPGSDLHHPFHATPEHRYLAGANLPGHVLAFDPLDGWTTFVPVLTGVDRIWDGSLAHRGVPLSHLTDWLDIRRGRPVAILGEPLPGVESDEELSHHLRNTVTASRRTKDEQEIAWIRRAAEATREGFLAAADRVRPGISERDLQIEVDYAMLKAGADRPAFDTTVAFGSNAAIFHFTPTGRALKPGEICLVDAGAEYCGYCSDVTRTWVVGGKVSAEQRDIHRLVLEAQQAAVGKCRPGKEYREIHLETCVQFAQGLVDLGLLKGTASSLVERGAHALFFPHGLGHLLGLTVHDAGGYLDGRERSDQFGLNFLRTDLPLERGFVVTIEPGLYFSREILTDAGRREEFADAVDWKLAERLLDLGGVRIEDDVLVTDGEPEILTPGISHDLTP
jgi:Xaa-Pro aminopeptidase